MQFHAGVEYMIVGVCDEDCPDLDLELLDPAGNVVDADIEGDAVPIVTVTSRRSGTYTVDVFMAACSAEPCRYGLGIYGR